MLVTTLPKPGAVFASVAVIRHRSDPDLVLAVTRRGRPDDWGLPGGKLDPGEHPAPACRRETLEETGVLILEGKHVYTRTDPTVDRLVNFYLISQWIGEPRAQEAGIEVAWRPWVSMLDPKNTFAPYYGGLFQHLGWVTRACRPDPRD